MFVTVLRMEDSGMRAISRSTLREWVLCVGPFYMSTQNLTGYDAGDQLPSI